MTSWPIKPTPWAICRTGSVSEVVAEAKSLERASLAVEYPTALRQWSECCWVWALMALLEGRRLSRVRAPQAQKLSFPTADCSVAFRFATLEDRERFWDWWHAHGAAAYESAK